MVTLVTLLLSVVSRSLLLIIGAGNFILDVMEILNLPLCFVLLIKLLLISLVLVLAKQEYQSKHLMDDLIVWPLAVNPQQQTNTLSRKDILDFTQNLMHSRINLLAASKNHRKLTKIWKKNSCLKTYIYVIRRLRVNILGITALSYFYVLFISLSTLRRINFGESWKK